MKVKFCYMLVAIMMLGMIAGSACAQEIQQNQLESVLVNVNGTIVEVNLIDYAMAIASGPSSPLYNYLNGTGDRPVIVGIKGGGKYMELTEYATYFATSGGNTSTAIDNSPALPNEQVNSIRIFSGFDEQGQPMLVPVAISAVTGRDLNVMIETVAPGVFNIIVTLENAQARLNATTDSILVLSVEGRGSLELLYNSKLLDGVGAFIAPAVQGYTPEEIRAAIASVKIPVRAQDLNVVIDPIVPGVVNISIPFSDAQGKLEAKTDSTLVLTVPGKADLELTYSASLLNGVGGFLAPAVQGYSDTEVKAGIVKLKK